MQRGTMLVYGSTGKCGRLTCERALKAGWRVVCFARNPDKVLEPVRSQAEIIKGNLNDSESIITAIKSCKPTVIVDASSALPFGHAKGQPPNDADRTILLRATVQALEEDNRLRDCVLLIVGGQLIPEPGGQINSLFASSLACLLRVFLGKAWIKILDTIKWLFEDSPPDFRFVMARMGQMDEQPSRGVLEPQPTHNNIQKGSASYCDVADAFVRLASDESKQWERKAIFFNYGKARKDSY